MSRSRKLRKNLKKKQKAQLAAQETNSAEIQESKATIEQRYFAGPLPHPDILDKYNAILPGAADRIITMAEKQAEHRQNIERRQQTSETVLSFTGQLCALLFVLTTVIGASYCILRGQPWGGVGLGATGIVSIVYAFIRGHRQKEESSDLSKS
ncbi:MAG: DUF2335 domain-containing protein [Sedimentisphaerales bacterium]|nr:DUF2335 domain-containing protein [Sedimentisphaerales bacterium]